MKLKHKISVDYIPTKELDDYVKIKLIEHNKTLSDIAKENHMCLSAVCYYLRDETRPFSAKRFNEIFKSLDINIDDRTKSIKERKNK